MFSPAPNDDLAAFPVELLRFSSQVPDSNRFRRRNPEKNTALIPLNGQDLKALTSLFDREDVEEILTDINTSLLSLLPEPCWDDNPFGFLGEYL